MENLVETLRSVLLHPLAISGLLLSVALWVILGRRILKLGSIIAELRELPVQDRRYTLERKYSIHPGKDNLPIAFARRKRRQTWIYLFAWTLTFTGALVAITLLAASRADTIVWTLDDSRLEPEEFGYNWQIELGNESDEIVLIEAIDIEVLAKQPHPETDRKRPEYPESAPRERYQAALKPYDDAAPVVRPAKNYSLGAGERRVVNLFLEAYHPAHEGWTYDVRLVFRWHVAGQTAVLTRMGTVYRLGWPGMPHWSEADSSAGPGTEAVTDPVVRISE